MLEKRGADERNKAGDDVQWIQEGKQQVIEHAEQDDSYCGKIKHGRMNENEMKMFTETWVREGIRWKEWREEWHKKEGKFKCMAWRIRPWGRCLYIYLPAYILTDSSRLIAPFLCLLSTVLCCVGRQLCSSSSHFELYRSVGDCACVFAVILYLVNV